MPDEHRDGIIRRRNVFGTGVAVLPDFELVALLQLVVMWDINVGRGVTR
jgi:hypothetical protein